MLKKNLKKVLSVVLAGAMMIMGTGVVPAHADVKYGEKVVTLGIDLDREQTEAIMRYFGATPESAKIIYITNQNERDHLASYIPLEQIGSRTYSCAYVQPKDSGGIQVKTANLTYVTGNMIASTLSTAGVKNCDVIAACPFKVSGTGALTGVIMAYEQASGETLDKEKTGIAAQELVTTEQLSSSVGQSNATLIVNEVKKEIIENNITDNSEIQEVVNNVVNNVTNNIDNSTNIEDNSTNIEDNSVTIHNELSEEDRAALNALAERIAQQEYEYEDMKETLNRIEQNVLQETGQTEDNEQTDEEPLPDMWDLFEEESETVTETESLPEESILMNTDDTALGEDVNISSTAPEALPETETTEDSGWEEETFSSDSEVLPETEASLETEQAEDVTLLNQEPEDLDVIGEDVQSIDEEAEGHVISEYAKNKNLLGITEIFVNDTVSEIASGVLTINREDNGENVTTTDFSSVPERFFFAPMTDSELMEKGWERGTRVFIINGMDCTDPIVYTTDLSYVNDFGETHSVKLSESMTADTSSFIIMPLMGATKRDFTVNLGPQFIIKPYIDMSAVSSIEIRSDNPDIVSTEESNILFSTETEDDYAGGYDGNPQFSIYNISTGSTNITITLMDEMGTEWESVTIPVSVIDP